VEVQQAQAQWAFDEPPYCEPPGGRVELWDLEVVAHVEPRGRHHAAADQRSDGCLAVEWIRPLEDKARFLSTPQGFLRIDCLDHLASRISRQVAWLTA
jgi:hypothetical protein